MIIRRGFAVLCVSLLSMSMAWAEAKPSKVKDFYNPKAQHVMLYSENDGLCNAVASYLDAKGVDPKLKGQIKFIDWTPVPNYKSNNVGSGVDAPSMSYALVDIQNNDKPRLLIRWRSYWNNKSIHLSDTINVYEPAEYPMERLQDGSVNRTPELSPKYSLDILGSFGSSAGVYKFHKLSDVPDVQGLPFVGSPNILEIIKYDGKYYLIFSSPSSPLPIGFSKEATLVTADVNNHSQDQCYFVAPSNIYDARAIKKFSSKNR